MSTTQSDNTDTPLTHATIQQAIDAAAARGGGTVRIPAGTYHMRNALHLRSNVHVAGEPGAVLRKAPSVSSALAQVVGFGHREFVASEPDHFRVGDGIHLASDHTGGFLNCVATIIDRAGDTFFIDQPAHYDYRTHQNARATTIHSLIDATDVCDASVRGLRLDGAEETVALNGCRGGGIFLLRSQRIVIEKCEIDRFNGDGISFQQCIDITIRQCDIHHCTGHGLHPGSGSVRYLITGNHAHHNGRDGLFYCLRTTHSIAEHNQLHHNGGSGISIGERDTDHLIEHNHIHENAGPGICFRPPVNQSGDRVRVIANTIGPNGNRKDEQQTTGEIDIAPGLCDVAILDNTIRSHGPWLASVGDHTTRLHIAGNTLNDRPQQPGDIQPGNPRVSLARPDTLMPLGPTALPLDGARHLGVAQMPPWKSNDTA